LEENVGNALTFTLLPLFPNGPAAFAAAFAKFLDLIRLQPMNPTLSPFHKKFRQSVLCLFAAGALPAQAAYVWLGTSDGLANSVLTSLNGDGNSVYAENNWDDDSIPGIQAAPADSINNSTQTISGINNAVLINNGGVSGGPNGGGSNTVHFRTNGNALTISGAGSGLKMAITGTGAGAWIENDGTTGGGRSTLLISNGGFLSTAALRDISATVTGSNSSLYFIGAGDNGLALNNSTIDLSGVSFGSSPTIHWASITAEQLFTAAVLGSITVNGAPGVWGSDPLVFEEGDNLIVTAATFNRIGNGALPQNNWYTTQRSGFSMVAVPEPSSALLVMLGSAIVFRRRRAN
jgi:hypothetical protein